MVPNEELPQWNASLRSLHEETGCTVELKTHSGAVRPKQVRDETGRLEINLAFETLRDAFADEPHQPYKTSKKTSDDGQPYIELAFISPQIGLRYAGKLHELETLLGWPLKVAQKSNTADVLATVRRLLQNDDVRKGPSFQSDRGCVSVRLRVPSDPEAWEKLREEVREQTGYELEAK